MGLVAVIPRIVVVIVGTAGDARQETWPAEGGLLDRLQGAVGGCVDVVALVAGENGLDMWVHDEGLYLCEPNPVATVIAQRFGLTSQPYFGPAVLTGGADSRGVTRGLTGGLATYLLARVGEIRADSAVVDAAMANFRR